MGLTPKDAAPAGASDPALRWWRRTTRRSARRSPCRSASTASPRRRRPHQKPGRRGKKSQTSNRTRRSGNSGSITRPSCCGETVGASLQYPADPDAALDPAPGGCGWRGRTARRWSGRRRRRLERPSRWLGKGSRRPSARTARAFRRPSRQSRRAGNLRPPPRRVSREICRSRRRSGPRGRTGAARPWVRSPRAWVVDGLGEAGEGTVGRRILGGGGRCGCGERPPEQQTVRGRGHMAEPTWLVRWTWRPDTMLPRSMTTGGEPDPAESSRLCKLTGCDGRRALPWEIADCFWAASHGSQIAAREQERRVDRPLATDRLPKLRAQIPGARRGPGPSRPRFPN